MRVDREVIAVVVETLRPGIVSYKLNAIVEALIYLHLQCVVIVHSIIAEERDILRPTKLVEERSAVIGWYRGKTYYRCLVDVNVWVVLIKTMTVVSNIRNLSRNRIRNLPLQRDVICIESRQAHSQRTGSSENRVRKR